MAEESGGTPLASSLTDLMTSLAVIFILLLVASLNNAQQQGQDTRNAILIELQKELSTFVAKGIEVKADPKDPLGLLVLVPEGLLEFEINDDRIPPKGIEFLKEFTPKLAFTACSQRFRTQINSIVVEGHTDKSGTDQLNLPLSQRRSMSVVQQSLDALTHSNGNEDFRSCFLGFLSASGRGSSELIKVSGIEDRARSRRVIFKIRVRSLEQKSLKEVLGASVSEPSTANAQ